jgi:hypothetical protein
VGDHIEQVLGPIDLGVGTRAASSALAGGSTRRAVACPVRAASRCRARLMARAPRTGRKSPPSDSSPANSQPFRRALSICPLAARMPRAIGRSKRPESLGRSAGARLTVMRWLLGKASPALAMAERTRSRASRTSVSTRPTRVKLGRPLARCTSTRTGTRVQAEQRTAVHHGQTHGFLPVLVHGSVVFPASSASPVVHLIGALGSLAPGDRTHGPGMMACPCPPGVHKWGMELRAGRPGSPVVQAVRQAQQPAPPGGFQVVGTVHASPVKAQASTLGVKVLRPGTSRSRRGTTA